MDWTDLNFFQIWEAGFGSFLNVQIGSSGFFDIGFLKQFEIFEFDSPLAGLQKKIFFFEKCIANNQPQSYIGKRLKNILANESRSNI